MPDFPQFDKGQRLKAKDLQFLSDRTIKSVRSGGNGRVRFSRDQLTVSAGRQAGQFLGRIAAMRIYTVLSDALICNTFDVFTNTYSSNVFIPVAKPISLQRSYWDGEEVSMPFGRLYGYTYSTAASYGGMRREVYDLTTSTASTLSETQVVTPYYFTGDIIRVLRCGTGVATSSGAVCGWEDINSGGRAWAAI